MLPSKTQDFRYILHVSDASDFANKHSGATVSLTYFYPIVPRQIVCKVVGWRDSPYFSSQVLVEPPLPDLGESDFATLRDRTHMTSVLGYHWLYDVDRYMEAFTSSLTLLSSTDTYIPDRKWPHICGECKKPAQLLFQFVDCSNFSCRHYRR